MTPLGALPELAGPLSHLSTGCTECCGNVDYSTFANCGIFRFATPCAVSREAIHSLLRRARRGSRTKQHREVVRGGSQGPKRKVNRGCGRNRDRLGEFFWSEPPAAAPRLPPRLGSPRCTRPVRRASTRASSPSSGRSASASTSTSGSSPSARAARRRSCSRWSRSRGSGFSCACAARTPVRRPRRRS